MRRRELDSRLLILVTLALVAFGLVMVYSATSANAAVGGKDPSYYLKRQGVYAPLGIADPRAALGLPAAEGARADADLQLAGSRCSAQVFGSPPGLVPLPGLEMT